MNFYGLSDKGLVRDVNQDSFCVLENKNRDILALVCDGIGGGNGGDVASKLAVDYIKNHFIIAKEFQNDVEVKRWILRIVQEANDLVLKEAKKNSTLEGMGTTCVGSLILDGATYVFNVGDSRVYALYDDLVCLTEDHSYLAKLMKQGNMSLEEANEHPGKNVLTNALGIWENIKVDVNKTKEGYASILLCSDGLHGYVSEAQIKRVLISKQSVCMKTKELVNLAKQSGGFDNVTVIILEQEAGETYA